MLPTSIIRHSNENVSGGYWPKIWSTPTDQPLPDVGLTLVQRCILNTNTPTITQRLHNVSMLSGNLSMSILIVWYVSKYEPKKQIDANIFNIMLIINLPKSYPKKNKCNRALSKFTKYYRIDLFILLYCCFSSIHYVAQLKAEHRS